MTQADAFCILKTGANVFLTGEPGAGKSHLVRTYVGYLAEHGVPVALTASTGIAATHIGGMTIHSWSGLGIQKSVTDGECKELALNKQVKSRIGGAKVLVIDEVSMLDGAMLDAVDKVCRAVRASGAPFGGLQVVLVGDFFQLPPVSRVGEPPARFAFEAAAWHEALDTVCYLSEQHRQEDPVFLDILSALRQGSVSEEHVAHLHARRMTPTDANITKLYAHNADVDELNARRLNKLAGDEHAFYMTANGPAKYVTGLKRGCLSPETLTLKVGARVMCTRNNPAKRYVNGSLGEVIGFHDETGFPLVRLGSGRVVDMEPETWSTVVAGMPLAAIQQIPLRLAWAMTIHKSQGMSLDGAFMDLGNTFAYGQGYVALSRVRTLKGLYLAGLNTRALEIDPAVLVKDAEFRAHSLKQEAAAVETPADEWAKKAEAFMQRCGGSKEAQADAVVAWDDIWGARPRKTREPKWTKTLALILEGKSIAETATERGRTVGTIVNHLEEARQLEKVPAEVLDGLRVGFAPVLNEVHPIMEELGGQFLKPIYERLEGKYSYNELRVAQWLFSCK